MGTDQTRERVSDALRAPLLDLGLDVEAVELTSAGRRRLLRVAVDRDGGVSLDELASATKEASRVLDGSNVMGQTPYTLEVTSPGVDRPLTLPRHWRRNQGRLVRARLHEGATVLGRIVDSDDRRAVVGVDDGLQDLAYADIARATVQVELSRKES